MGKIKRNVLIMGLCALALCLTLLGVVSVFPANAASETNTVIDENFNRTDSEQDWVANSFDIYRENFSLQYGNSEFGDGLVLTKYKIEKSCTVSYKVKIYGSGSYSGLGLQWVGLQLGLENLSIGTSQAGAMFVSYHNGHTGLMDHEDGSKPNLTNESLTANKTYPGGICTYGRDGGTACVELELTRRDPNAENGKDAAGRVLYDVAYRVWKDGAQRPDSALNWNNKGVGADGYLAFGGIIEASTYLRIYDFKIKEGQEVVFDAEFDQNIDEQIGGRTATWCARDIPLTDCAIAADSYVDTKDVTTGILMSATQLAVDPYVYKQFDLSFDADCSALAEGASFGVGFGLSTLSKLPDELNYIGVKGLADGKWKFVMTYGGKDRASSVAFDSFPAGVQKMRFEGFYDGSVKVTFGGESETFKGIDFVGNFALATLGTVASGVKFDNVVLSVTAKKTTDGVAEDRAIDFSGTRKIKDGETVYEITYIDSSKWYSGTNVRLARDGGKYVQFASSTDTSAFGPRSRYDEFICRFSVTASQNRSVVPNGAAIGLSFGRRSFYSGNTASAGFFFEKTSDGMQMRIYNASSEQARNGVIAVPADMDIWSSNDVAENPVTYNIMVVVRGGNADIYFAPSDAPASEMEIVRARLTGFSGYGFVAVAGRGGSAFRLNNISVINAASGKVSIASMKSAATRIDFTDDSLYTVSGDVKTGDEGATLSAQSSVKTKEKWTNFLLYTDITTTDGSIEISFGANNAIKFTSDGKIETQLNKISGVNEFSYSDFSEGGIIAIEVVGNRVTVGVSARVAPEEFLHQPIAVYTCENEIGEIKISAQSNANVRYVNVYSLSGTIEIAPDDWEEGDGDYPVKPAREGAEVKDEEKPDGLLIGLVTGGSVLFVAAVVLVIALVLRSKQAKKDGKKEEVTSEGEGHEKE